MNEMGLFNASAVPVSALSSLWGGAYVDEGAVYDAILRRWRAFPVQAFPGLRQLLPSRSILPASTPDRHSPLAAVLPPPLWKIGTHPHTPWEWQDECNICGTWPDGSLTAGPPVSPPRPWSSCLLSHCGTGPRNTVRGWGVWSRPRC